RDSRSRRACRQHARFPNIKITARRPHDLAQETAMTDHDEIRNLFAQYSHYADDDRFEDYPALFSRDGVLVEGGVELPREKMPILMRTYAKFKREMAQPYGSKHLQVNSAIYVDGDKATAVTDLVDIKLKPSGWHIGGSGRYNDE